MQAWLHGKSVKSVLGVAEYSNPDTGVTSVFRTKDLRYYIKSGYCTLHNDSGEIQTAELPNVSALTEENLRTRGSMLEPEPNATQDRQYSPTTIASSVSNYTMSKSETASEKSARFKHLIGHVTTHTQETTPKYRHHNTRNKHTNNSQNRPRNPQTDDH